ncbi:AraC family transcriptional regulator, partial [Paenibacillus agaridevorans]|uniref:AraC family transcriptional regulator n=1 Tax=Paenibacillus agaridevorans TaxID=171404 RepID=UPI0011B288C5
MSNKPEFEPARAKSARVAPSLYGGIPGGRMDGSSSLLRVPPGEELLIGEGQPLVFLRRVVHYTGQWPSTMKRRRVGVFSLLYIKHGRGELTVNNVPISITGNQLLLLTPGMYMIEQADALADWDVHYSAFKLMRPVREDGGWSLAPFEPSHFPRGGAMSVTDMHSIERLIERLYKGGDDADGMFRWRRQLALSELLYMILSEQKAQRSPYSAPDVVRRCAAYIDQHYKDNIRMDELASWCGLHPSTFTRHFKAAMGMLPSDYLIHARIESAKTILPGGGPLREVARQVGFCDEYYFSRMFKKVAGVSPSVYIRTAGERSQGKERNGRVLKPVNVAVTYVDEVDHLIALGLLPAAVPADHQPDRQETVIPYLKPYIAHLPHIGCELSIDMERLRKLAPELIIVGRFMKSWGVNGFADIAPTHYYSWEVDWRNVHRQLSAVLGREAHAEQNIAQFDRLVRSARDRMYAACASKTFLFLESTREGVRVSPYMSNGGWLLYQQLGLTPASIVSVNGWEHYV